MSTRIFPKLLFLAADFLIPFPFHIPEHLKPARQLLFALFISTYPLQAMARNQLIHLLYVPRKPKLALANCSLLPLQPSSVCWTSTSNSPSLNAWNLSYFLLAPDRWTHPYLEYSTIRLNTKVYLILLDYVVLYLIIIIEKNIIFLKKNFNILMTCHELLYCDRK